MSKNAWTCPLPIYVTRKTASGETGELNVSMWMGILLLFLVLLNAFAWSIIGLYVAVRLVLV